jgi:hypothetical protein
LLNLLFVLEHSLIETAWARLAAECPAEKISGVAVRGKCAYIGHRVFSAALVLQDWGGKFFAKPRAAIFCDLHRDAGSVIHARFGVLERVQNSIEPEVLSLAPSVYYRPLTKTHPLSNERAAAVSL